MPRKALFTEEEIVEAGLAVVREQGASALTARAVGKRLGASARPIFTVLSGMDELRRKVAAAANAVYCRYVEEGMKRADKPYMGSGLGYIRFASEEKQLFRLLFLTDELTRRDESGMDAYMEKVYGLIQRGTGLSRADAERMHLEMWMFVHGIATVAATDSRIFPEPLVKEMMSDAYYGILGRMRERAKTEKE